VAFLGVWMVVGVGVLSHMSRLQPRYLDAVTPAIAAVIGVAIARLAALAPRRNGALVALALVAVLAVPAASAVTVAGQHRSNAGLPVPAPAPGLSAFLLSHQNGARYEVASPAVARASTLIIRDGQPVLMLTSLYGQPLLTPARLQHLVATGQVRYLLGRGGCGKTGACPPVLRWAHRHAHDVSRAAGLAPGTISRLSVR
jgi:4-amino-4-deoxy-L-arabinose transferase-like glycosyltransferase